jgi:sugar lactone lactonase YvrE
LAGTGSPGFVNGTGTAAQFNQPAGIAVDSVGNVYVSEIANHAIRKISPSGAVSTLAGTGSPGFVNGTGTAAQFNQPCGVAVDRDGHLYVAEWRNHVIRKISPTGTVNTFAGSGAAGFVDGPASIARFAYPNGVAVYGASIVYVGDYGNNAVRKIVP